MIFIKIDLLQCCLTSGRQIRTNTDQYKPMSNPREEISDSYQLFAYLCLLESGEQMEKAKDFQKFDELPDEVLSKALDVTQIPARSDCQQTLKKMSYSRANEFLRKHFSKKISVLDPFSGNGKANKAVWEGIEHDMIMTDLYVENPMTKEKIVAHDAVKKYQFDVLFICCPPPNNPSDYYAVKALEESPSCKSTRIIYIGEMGASDGCGGMWKYMHKDSYWKLVDSEVLETKTISFPYPDEANKEIYLFEHKDSESEKKSDS